MLTPRKTPGAVALLTVGTTSPSIPMRPPAERARVERADRIGLDGPYSDCTTGVEIVGAADRSKRISDPPGRFGRAGA